MGDFSRAACYAGAVETIDVDQRETRVCGDLNSQSYFVIRVQGHISDDRADLFARMGILREDDGTTTLSGFLPDQTALHGILLCIRDMNLKLISVNQMEAPLDDVLKG